MRRIDQIRFLLSAVTLMGCCAGHASAVVSTVINVPNASFESPASGDGLYKWTSVNGDSTTVPDWTFTATVPAYFETGGGAQNSVNAEFPGTTGSPGLLPTPGDGVQYGWLNLWNNSARSASFTSGVVVPQIQSYSKYTLTVAMGDRLNEEPAEEGIALLVNGTIPLGGDAWIGGSQLIEGGFLDLSVSITTGDISDALVGGSLSVQLMHRKPITSGITVFQANYDNVRLSVTPTPEPAGGLLSLILTISMLYRRRPLKSYL